MSDQETLVLFCHCDNSDIIPESTKEQVLEHLRKQEIPFVSIADLCGAVAQKDADLLSALASERLTIIACYPRAVKNLLLALEVLPDRQELVLLNMRERTPDEIIAALPKHSSAVDSQVTRKGHWRPWFPVIDHERCSGCGQCMDFCLFGVYVRDVADKVKVSQPANCKNECPACARICPQVAIIFPKLKEGPINGGEVVDEELAQSQVKLNIQKILGNDVYAALAQRKNKRKELLKRQSLQRAEAERHSFTEESGENSEEK